MSSDLAVRVEGLSKAYTIKHNETDHVTLAEVALDRVRHPLRRAQQEKLWALKDINFDVREGEVLGLIGRNGAGKSTLLKVLSRITDPTEGQIDLWGRVGSLLEVGTGFHPELTGRENIYLNGSILGMGRRHIQSQFDAIVEFAGVERFLDTPVKRYSSGMFVRLAFAVAAHLETEILLLDEVLAVGDADFQAKCLGKVQELSGAGRTVILVSHNMTSIRNFATRTIMLEAGTIRAEGETSAVLETYGQGRTAAITVKAADQPRLRAEFGERLRILEVILENSAGEVGIEDPFRYTLLVQANETLKGLRVAQSIRTVDGQPHSTSFGAECIDVAAGGRYRIEIELPWHALASGRYYLNVSLGWGGLYAAVRTLDGVKSVDFEVPPPVDEEGRASQWHAESWGHVRLPEPRLLALNKVGENVVAE